MLTMGNPTRRLLDVSIRWAAIADGPALARIETACFRDPWTVADFLKAIRSLPLLCRVAVARPQGTVGFLVLRLARNGYDVVNLAVDPAFQRRGVGSRLVNDLVGLAEKRTSEKKRPTRLALRCRERNLPAQVFFRSCGFRWVDTLPAFYRDGEDAYRMEFAR